MTKAIIVGYATLVPILWFGLQAVPFDQRVMLTLAMAVLSAGIFKRLL